MECTAWDRVALRAGAGFLFNLLGCVVESAAERSRTVLRAVDEVYPGVFLESELEEISRVLEE